MADLLPLDDTEVKTLKDKVRAARAALSTVRDIRKKCADAYFRQPLGTEVDGRSDYVASTVHNHVEGTVPALIKRNLAADVKIKIKGPNDLACKKLKVWVRSQINKRGRGFRFFNDVLKDGLIYSNGTAKIWWQRIWDKPISGEQIVDEQQLMTLQQDVNWRVNTVEPLPQRVNIDIDPSHPTDPVMVAQGKQMYRIQATNQQLLESGPVIVPMPPEEFVAEKGKVHMNDRKGCGHIREMLGGELVRENEKLSMPGAPYYRNLSAAIKTSVDTTLSEEKQERDVRQAPYWDYSLDPVEEVYDVADLRRKCTVIEWADYVVSGGKLVPAIVTFVNGEVVRVEKNEDGIVPYATWSPMVDSHSIYGHGVGWLHADDQNLQTVLTRAVADNVAFSIDKPRLISARSADLLGLQNLTPGKLVVGHEGDYKDIDVGNLDYRTLQFLEFLKGEGEERGPGTRYNMGTDAETLNATATGVSLIQRASMNKIDMISLAFSELFLVDVYNKMIYLAQNNLDIPAVVIVDGEVMEMTRDEIQGDYYAEGDFGMEVDFDDRGYTKAQSNLAAAMQVAQAYPMLMPIEVMQEYLKDLLLASGEKELHAKLPPIPEMFKGWFPNREAMIMQMMQMQMAMQQAMSGGAPASPGGPPAPGGGAPPVGGVAPAGPQDTGTGITEPEPQGADFVGGPGMSGMDETMGA